MANIRVGNGFGPFSLSTVLSAVFSDGTFQHENGFGFELDLTQPAGVVVHVTGATLRYDADHFPVSGTIHSFSLTAPGAPFALLTVKQIDLSITDLTAVLHTHRLGDDLTLLKQVLSGPDTIVGGNAKDQLMGFGGNDTIDGRGGNDLLTGGAGNDTFVFDGKPNKTNVDTITDFTHGHDHIELDNSVFTALTHTGTLAAKFFAVSDTGKAQDGNDHIIYDQQTGALFYDPDGTGTQAGVQFATVAPHLHLTHADFLVS